MREDIAHGNDAIARWDAGKQVRGEIAQAVKSLADDLEFTFEQQLQEQKTDETGAIAASGLRAPTAMQVAMERMMDRTIGPAEQVTPSRPAVTDSQPTAIAPQETAAPQTPPEGIKEVSRWTGIKTGPREVMAMRAANGAGELVAVRNPNGKLDRVMIGTDALAHLAAARTDGDK